MAQGVKDLIHFKADKDILSLSQIALHAFDSYFKELPVNSIVKYIGFVLCFAMMEQYWNCTTLHIMEMLYERL